MGQLIPTGDATSLELDVDGSDQIVTLCREGVVVAILYNLFEGFENVGGSSWEAVMPLLNNFARVPVCGLIAHYNQTSLPPGPDRMSLLQGMLLRRRIKMQGFIVSDHQDRVPDFVRDVSNWLAQGKIKYREHVVNGLENAPQAFLGLFTGTNFGKLIVKL